MSWSDAIVVAAYASLLVEITCFPIPSEASTWQLLAHPGGLGGGALAAARRRPRAAKLLAYAVPTVLGVLLFLVPLVCIAAPPARATLGPWTHPVGTGVGGALVVFGRTITFTSVLQLRRQRRLGGPARFAVGWFRWSRNPGLGGMFLFYAGLAVMFGAPLLWCGAPLYAANMHRRVRLEEAHLVATCGDAFRDYAARVPRYLALPGLR